MFKIRHFAYVDSEVTPTSVLNIAHKNIQVWITYFIHFVQNFSL